MSAQILSWSIIVSQLLLGLAMACSVARMLLGPRAQDRALALDAMYTSALLLILPFRVRTVNTLYFEAALFIALLGFVSTVAVSKFLMRGEVIE